MSLPKDLLRRPTPIGSRVIERRTRTRAPYGPSELAPILLAADMAVGVTRFFGRGGAWLWRRLRLIGRRPITRLPALDGASAPLRVRGVVEPLAPAFASPGCATPVIFAHTIFLNQARPGQPRSLSDELRGVDFRIRLPSGEAIEVTASVVRLGDPPARVLRPNVDALEERGGDATRSLFFSLPALVREAHIRTGDTVEALGVLVQEVSPAGAGAFGRGTPLVTRLVPMAGHKTLWLRRA